ncbi:MAG: hypothetical protein ACFFCT_02665 [Candidatus Odinarchaeota archaeon]
MIIRVGSLVNSVKETQKVVPHSKFRGWFAKKYRNRNASEKKAEVKNCLSCSNNLSNLAYWKPSPCSSCIRSSKNYPRLITTGLVDNWSGLNSERRVRWSNVF